MNGEENPQVTSRGDFLGLPRVREAATDFVDALRLASASNMPSEESNKRVGGNGNLWDRLLGYTLRRRGFLKLAAVTGGAVVRLDAGTGVVEAGGRDGVDLNEDRTTDGQYEHGEYDQEEATRRPGWDEIIIVSEWRQEGDEWVENERISKFEDLEKPVLEVPEEVIRALSVNGLLSKEDEQLLRERMPEVLDRLSGLKKVSTGVARVLRQSWLQEKMDVIAAPFWELLYVCSRFEEIGRGEVIDEGLLGMRKWKSLLWAMVEESGEDFDRTLKENASEKIAKQPIGLAEEIDSSLHDLLSKHAVDEAWYELGGRMIAQLNEHYPLMAAPVEALVLSHKDEFQHVGGQNVANENLIRLLATSYSIGQTEISPYDGIGNGRWLSTWLHEWGHNIQPNINRGNDNGALFSRSEGTINPYIGSMGVTNSFKFLADMVMSADRVVSMFGEIGGEDMMRWWLFGESEPSLDAESVLKIREVAEIVRGTMNMEMLGDPNLESSGEFQVYRNEGIQKDLLVVMDVLRGAKWVESHPGFDIQTVSDAFKVGIAQVLHFLVNPPMGTRKQLWLGVDVGDFSNTQKCLQEILQLVDAKRQELMSGGEFKASSIVEGKLNPYLYLSMSNGDLDLGYRLWNNEVSQIIIQKPEAELEATLDERVEKLYAQVERFYESKEVFKRDWDVLVLRFVYDYTFTLMLGEQEGDLTIEEVRQKFLSNQGEEYWGDWLRPYVRRLTDEGVAKFRQVFPDRWEWFERCGIEGIRKEPFGQEKVEAAG